MSTTIETPVPACCPQETGETEGTEDMGAGFEPMRMCPMAGMCEGMMKPGAWSGWVMLLPGLLLVAAGLLIILVPEAIVWFLGGAAIFMGLGFLFMASRFRRLMAGPGSE